MTRSTSLNTGIPARDISYGVSQYIYATFAYNTPNVGTAATVAVGTLPAGSRVTRLVIYIDTAFNATTTNEMQIGVSGSAASFLPNGTVDMTATGAQEYPNLASVLIFTSDTTVYVEYDQTGTAATTGAGAVLIEYIAANNS